MKFTADTQFLVHMDEYGEWVANPVQENARVADIEGRANHPLLALHELITTLNLEETKETKEDLHKYVL